VGPLQLALAGEVGLEGVPELEQHLDVERGVDQPGFRERPGRPVRSAVALLEPVAQDVLDHGAEADPLEPREPPGELGVEHRRRHHTDLGQAGDVLGGRVQHPLLALQHLSEQRQVGAADRVDERRPGALAAQLHEVGTLGVPVARGPLGVDGDRAGTGGEAGNDLGERRGGLGDGWGALPRHEEMVHLGL
jgi:hypothetical protein